MDKSSVQVLDYLELVISGPNSSIVLGRVHAHFDLSEVPIEYLPIVEEALLRTHRAWTLGINDTLEEVSEHPQFSTPLKVSTFYPPDDRPAPLSLWERLRRWFNDL